MSQITPEARAVRDTRTEARLLAAAETMGRILNATETNLDDSQEVIELLARAESLTGLSRLFSIGTVLRILDFPFDSEREKEKKNIEGFRRGFVFLERAFPNYNTRSWNNTYIDVALMCATELFSQKIGSSPSHRSQTHLERFELWLSGESKEDIARRTFVAPETVRLWIYQFPKIFSQRVNYYELVHAADSLYSVVDSVANPVEN
ncbi:hypothetical protein HYW35_01305 [Candidatus Saccharibacteria bacterium]|nr:hypothetical protein [Candidatus Saccharibacteria bacterium]